MNEELSKAAAVATILKNIPDFFDGINIELIDIYDAKELMYFYEQRIKDDSSEFFFK